MKHSITRSIVALTIAASGAVFAAAPSASADPGLDNPSGTLTVECPGAWAFLQVDWKGANAVTIRWRVEDTGTAANMYPVLRITAHDGSHAAAQFTFPSGNDYFILGSGNGTHEVGLKSEWNPGNLADINHLLVKVQNGTTAQGTSCVQEREIFNWTRIAYKNAVSKEGARYLLGGTGPSYDCSGLVATSYDAIAGFPNFMPDVRSAQELYTWASAHTSPAKRYAKRVPVADLKVGDLLFYNASSDSRFIDHVAFWAGNNTLFDANSGSMSVGFHSNSSFWTSHFVAAYRILGVSTL